MNELKFVMICPNGEPDVDLWSIFGSFSSKDHAKLWLTTVHFGGFSPCDMAPFEAHVITSLYRPYIPGEAP